MDLSNTTHERNSEDVSHLDTGEGNSVATGQIQVLDRDTNHALTVRAAFDPLSAMADEWMERARLIHVTDIGQTEDMAFARESRLGLRKVVGNIERTRKEMKADALQRGRDIDKIAGDLEDKIRPVMEHLREQEEFAIRHERERLAGIRSARETELVALGTDPRLYTDLASVSDDGYAQILAIAKAAHDAKVEAARLAEVAMVEEAQRVAAAKEAERLERARQDAERLERERVQAEENARLKAEAEERDRRDAIAAEALRIEREGAAAIAKAEREEHERARQRAEAQARIEREKIEEQARVARVAHEKALRVEREARERAEREAAAERYRVAAEREAREREEQERAEALAEEQRQRALAPDREKLLAYAEALAAVPQPVLATTAGLSALGKIVEQVTKLVAGIRRLAGGL